MRKQLGAVVLATTIAFSMIPMQNNVAQANANAQGEVIFGVNFRSGPSTSSSIIRALSRGETVTILEQTSSNWYKIRDRNGRIGYVSSSSKYISVNGSVSNTAEVIFGVALRSGPSTSNSLIRYLSVGENVTIIGQPNSNWYQVRDSNGRTGYASSSSKYFKTGTSSSSSSSAEVIFGVALRSGPSTSNSLIRYLSVGERVTIIGQPSSNWYHVRDSNGRTGYASSNSKYFRTSGSSSSGSSGSSSSGSTSTSSNAQKVINAGMKYIGTPYEFGSSRSSTRTFDCSDFVRRSFINALGITLPGDSRSQADYVKKKGKTTTNWRNLKVGDLMFFMDYRGTKASDYSGINKQNQRISHVAIYLGNGRILHTYSVASGGVRTDTIQGKHWEYRFVFGGTAW